MKHTILSLDYFALAKEAKALKTEVAAKVIRIALLADCATQHLASIMRAIAARNNARAEIYEGNYDGVDLEILDPNSALYGFAPQYVVILLSSEKLKARLYASSDRRGFADETVGRLENLWAAFRAQSQATIVQSTFVLPSERAFGNYELKVAEFARLDLHRDQLPARGQSSGVQERPFERRRFSGCVGRPDGNGSTRECGTWRRRPAGSSIFPFSRNHSSTPCSPPRACL